MTRYDFHATNAAGVTVATFGDLALARRWVRENMDLHNGLKVECVTTTIRREVVYRPRQATDATVIPMRRRVGA